MKLKIKKTHPEAKVPQYMTDGAISLDLYAVSVETHQLNTGPVAVYDTGIAVEVPEGYGCFVVPRSSITTKTTMTLGNSFGVIDQDFRDGIKFQFRLNPPGLGLNTIYKVGERIGQMFFTPIVKAEIQVVEDLSETKRGTGGFGSTGTN